MRVQRARDRAGMTDHSGGVLDVIRFLARGALFAIVTGLAAAVAVYTVALRVRPTYEASSTVFAAKASIDTRALGLLLPTPAPLDANAYAFAATSNEVVSNALGILGYPSVRSSDIQTFRDEIRTSVEDTQSASFVVFRVRARSPDAAAKGANAIASALVAWDTARSRKSLTRVADSIAVQVKALKDQAQVLAGTDGDVASQLLRENANLQLQQEGNLVVAKALAELNTGSLEVLQTASPPSTPASPRPLVDTVVAFGLGLILTYGVIAVFEAFSRSRRHAVRPAQ